MKNSANQLVQKFGPWALVTGASDGIGRAFCRELARNGFNLVLASRREAELKAFRVELEQEYFVECEVFAADLSDLMAVERLVRFCDVFDVGLVVAAAGFGTSGTFLGCTLLQETELIDLNCTSVAVLSWHFGQRFKSKQRGGLVLFSSVLAFSGVPLSANYAASKAYIQSFAEALALEWEDLGLHVVACAPGPTESGFAKRAKLNMGRTISAQTVARQTLNVLGKKTFIRPGWLSKLLGWSLSMVPRFIRSRILGKVMADMASKYG